MSPKIHNAAAQCWEVQETTKPTIVWKDFAILPSQPQSQQARSLRHVMNHCKLSHCMFLMKLQHKRCASYSLVLLLPTALTAAVFPAQSLHTHHQPLQSVRRLFAAAAAAIASASQLADAIVSNPLLLLLLPALAAHRWQPIQPQVLELADVAPEVTPKDARELPNLQQAQQAHSSHCRDKQVTRQKPT